jgi:hypothetical protein
VTKVQLRRFWFPIPGHMGIGVTAYTRAEAEGIAREAAASLHWDFHADGCVEDVDVRTLDQKHVIPNMGVVVRQGVWYPNLQPMFGG